MVNITEGGIGIDVTLTPSQDYCGYYGLGDTLTTQISTNEGAQTGFTPPTPYSSYQVGDGHGNLCQANATQWGLESRKAVSGNRCATTGLSCGLHHYISFRSGTNDHPWSSAFGESPALIVSAESDPQTFTYGTTAKGWGYVCPEVEEPATKTILEYCLQEWRGVHNELEKPKWETEHIGECKSWGEHNIDLVNTIFWTNTQYATKREGSASTYVWSAAGGHHFEAEITTANLVSAISADQTACANSRNEKLSTSPSDWVLVGVEQGHEGWSGVTKMGESTGNLRLFTEYTPPPAATPWTFRDPNTSNQYVFFRGADGALWEELWTAAAGWKLNRIGGAVVGTPTGYIQSSGDINIFYRGTDNAIWQFYYEHTTGAWHEIRLGGSAAGRPQGYLEPSGEQNIFFRGTNNAIWQWYWNAGTGWHLIELGGSAAGDPYGYWNNGGQNVFYRTTEGTIGQWWWDAGSGWHNTPLGGSAAGDPQGYVQPNGTQNIFYRTSEGTVGQWWWTSSSGWHNSPLGGSAIGNPFAIFAPNGTQHVFYRGSGGTIWEWYYEEASGWHNHELGESAETDPGAFVQPNNNLNVYFFQGGADALDQWFFNGTWNISTICSGPCG